MASNGSLFGQIASNLVAAALMIFLAVLSFFVTVFVVDVGAGLAGYDSNPLFVLAAAILAGSAIVAGGVAPIGEVAGVGGDDVRDPLE
ncbi:hypothetical protein [Salinarchaeum chitinilyticum]